MSRFTDPTASITSGLSRRNGTLLGHRAQLTNRRLAQLRKRQATPPSTADPQPSPEELQRKAELERELQLARDIQQGLLLAAAPRLPGWELTAVSLPAHDLGGDLYDFLALSGGWHGIMIGDVAGKGLPAALQMAVTRTVFRHAARDEKSPAETLADVNRGVISEIPYGMVTMLYALLDPVQGTMRFANAGHTFPLLVNGSVCELELPGLPLGVDTDIDYEETTVHLGPGDSIVLYSDGVTEATNIEYDMYGVERAQELLAANRTLKPRGMVSLLLSELRTWSTGYGQSDDVTIVVLRRRLASLSDELQSIVLDVLGDERSAEIWHEVANQTPVPAAQATADTWLEFLPLLAKTVQVRSGRGLARELNQQLRLALEDYR